MGNTITQYRAAIGNFYFVGRHISRTSTFVCQFNITFKTLFRALAKYTSITFHTLASFALELNFFIQFYCFILLLSGDVEVNPGPTFENALDIIHLNIRSIRNKLDYLNTFIHDFDIACFTETHLDSSILDDDLTLDGFTSIQRKDRNSFGGGVIIYLSSAVSAFRRKDLEPSSIECIWLELDNPTCKYFLCCLYRPPHTNSTFWNNLSWSSDGVSEKSDKIIIVGDLNVDFLNIQNTHVIRDILSNNVLVNLISEPTRITNTTRTLIDPILASHSVDFIEAYTLNIDAHISDHRATCISISQKHNSNRSYTRKIWQYKNADIDTINSLTASCDWGSRITDADNIDSATINFSIKYMSLVRECIPEKTVTIRPKDKPWFDSTLRKTIRKRDRLHNIALKQARIGLVKIS
uniref:Uncharacterized protein LOC111100237 isoform X1 n=1 Tax=Crassostrea virginica TaxID=6565 RepID=A0A8B8A823_CRAVI|nr:uncharacterized protein LOC111100237 isoform X1 [Crassostrea virginica]XP_022287617.1 uncharacterized protein LOC111100237 isoform X1 [Crassostrea virginica]XP_022287618.1 uncharacterized protein LOC111100237 isoform X1 [Crassostrea virginica]